jgi:ABC-2 type transport system ATP-binding protein
VVRTAESGSDTAEAAAGAALEAIGVSKRFKTTLALDTVSLRLRPGEIHALLGPNGAGKTTLIRILVGLVDADEGEVTIAGVSGPDLTTRRARRLFGLVPSGDRTFYLRLSGLENLLFFARLQGMPRREALGRARECLDDVGLAEFARQAVGTYSHGMQKRLSIARAMLTDPPILLLDEATHDLDPWGARRIQTLVTRQAERGAASVWATQRVDEIRGFADRVTLLDRGTVRFTGTIPELMATSVRKAHIVHLKNSAPDQGVVLRTARAALGDLGTIRPVTDPDGEHYRLALREDVVLGAALSALSGSGLQVLACREERSEVELAFLHLTRGGE